MAKGLIDSTVQDDRKAGVFLIETPWGLHNDALSKATLRPVIDLVQSLVSFESQYFTCTTAHEFESIIELWIETDPDEYPILFLGFHGGEGYISIGTDEEKVGLSDLANQLAGRARPRVIYFGGCAALDVPRSEREDFLNISNALAVCGYSKDVPWIEAAAFESIMLATFQDFTRTVQGIKAVDRHLREAAGSLYDALGFEMTILPYR